MNDVNSGFGALGARLLAGVSMVALGLAAAPAFAQDAPAPAPAEDEQTEAAPDPAGTIVVTGRRAALRAATERKRRSETIIDSVVADEAGKLPDNSITEVLQRVAGVSIVRFRALNDPDHFSVEGSGIQVRGLSGVASRLNGRDIFSANNGRALLWGDVTPELMAAVDVYKASTADLIEGGTGGQVDLRTKLPFDFKSGWHFAGSGEYSRGDFAKKNDWSASGLVTNRWETPIGEIGVLVDLAYSKLSTNSHFFRMEPYFKTLIGDTDYFIPGGYDFGEDDYQRKRSGIYGAVQWAPTDSLMLTGIFFQSRYKSRTIAQGAFVTSNQLSVDLEKSVFDDANGLISSHNIFHRNPQDFLPSGNPITSGGNSAFTHSDSMTRDMSLSFNFTPEASPLSISGAIQRVRGEADDDGMNIFRDVDFPTSFGLDLSDEFPEVRVPESGLAAFDDPAAYRWAASMPHNARNRGKMTAANLDVEYKFDDSFFRSVKVGGRLSKRTERDLDNGFNWAALGRGWNGVPFDPNVPVPYAPQLTFANAAPGDIEGHVFDNFFGGNIGVPTNYLFPSLDLLRRVISDRELLHRAPPNTFPDSLVTVANQGTFTGFCGTPDWGGTYGTNCSSAGPLPQTGYGNHTGIRQPGFLPQDETNYRTIQNAIYGLVRFGKEDALNFSGNVGVRLVKLKNRSSGFFQFSAMTFVLDDVIVVLDDFNQVVSGGASFTRVLPSVNLQIEPTRTTKVRFAHNRTMDNATFYALRASGSLGAETSENPGGEGLPPVLSHFTTSSGNPELRPAISRNTDLSFEWYPRDGALVHLALFHKRITDLPIFSSAEQPVTVTFEDGTTLETVARTTDATNATEAATVKGVEVGGRMFFDRLPGLLRGIGLEANYTFIDSKNPGDLYRDINGVEHNDAPLQGLSKHNFNVTWLYELNRISARIAYSWRSKYLQSTNSNGTNPTYCYWHTVGSPTNDCNNDAGAPFRDRIAIALPVYGSSYGQVDGGIRYKVNDNLSLSLQGTNLLNATQKTLMGGYPEGKLYVRSWFQSDRRIAAGFNFSF